MGAPATGIQDFGKLLLRLTIGGNLVLHGIHKVRSGIDFIHQAVGARGLPDLLSYGVFVGEVVGPLLILVGLFSRLGGLFVAINMVFAVYLAKTAALGELTAQGAWGVELDSLYFL